MDFTEAEVVEVRLWYGKCADNERNDINTEHLFIFIRDGVFQETNLANSQLNSVLTSVAICRVR